MLTARIDIPMDKIRDFCRRWKITELALFGSVLRDDFRPDSDVDVLVSFEADDPWSYGHDWFTMIAELEALFGRPVDFVEKELLQNPYRRDEILRNMQVIYAS
jgi:predicted nucleotidyltransferase